MSKNIKEIILQYFNIQNESLEVYALCKICQKKLKNIEHFNLKRHLIKIHKNIAVENSLIKSDTEDLKEYKVKFHRENIIKNVVKLLTKDGVPYSVLTYESFKAITKPLFEVANININSNNIANTIEKTTDFFKNIIKSEIKDKLICLKIDSA